MALTSYIEEEGPGRGRGHYEHGNGKGLGHAKHAEKAMADGVYNIAVGGIGVVNAGTTSIDSVPALLADGSSLSTEVRQGSLTIGASPTGDQALHFVTDSANGRLRLNVAFDADQHVTLGALDNVGFDYYVVSSDTTIHAPVLRIAVDADGDLSTTNDRGELVFEYAYQDAGAVVQGAWRTADISGDDWVAWQRSNGANHDAVAQMTTLSNWADADGYTPTAGLAGEAGATLHFDENSVVLGFSVALGSGNGTTNAYVNNLHVSGVSYDFV
jgi:hypothetical protein